MKNLIFLILTTIGLSAYGQDKYNHIKFDKLIEVEGTDFVIAIVESLGKLEGHKGSSLLFIDTKTGQTNQVDLPPKGYFEKIQQVKIDSLGINKIIVLAKSIDLNGKKGIDWNDPKQIIVLSVDGNERVQLTDNKLFVRTWIINRQTGTIVIAGHYDTNNNNKYDKADKNEIEIYDLITLKLICRI